MVLLAHMYVHHVCALCVHRSEEAIKSPRTGGS